MLLRQLHIIGLIKLISDTIYLVFDTKVNS